jgi:hypothetical protein
MSTISRASSGPLAHDEIGHPSSVYFALGCMIVADAVNLRFGIALTRHHVETR